MLNDPVLVNEWHVVARTTDVQEGKPFRARLLGEDLVLWRVGDRVMAWQDLCVHRGTRLSLELRQGANGVEAQAVLHRGDFQYLNQHWSELQQRLEPRGVHLATLQSSTDSAAGDRSFQQSGGQSSKDEPARTAFAEFAFGGSMTESPSTRKARTKTHRGWESWA